MKALNTTALTTKLFWVVQLDGYDCQFEIDMDNSMIHLANVASGLFWETPALSHLVLTAVSKLFVFFQLVLVVTFL